MQVEFKAVVLANELHLTNIAQHFGIAKKFKWEESLQLRDNALQGIVHNPEGKWISIFHFGSIVFVNFQHHEIMDVVNYLQKIEPDMDSKAPFRYADDYKLEIDPTVPPAINNDFMVTAQAAVYHLEIVSTVLAKSVALDKIEFDISILLDKIEDVVTHLYQGDLSVSDEKLAQMSASILGFKLNTLSYVMLLDKPAITWVNEEAGILFNELSTLFELNERYGNIRHKTDALMDITEVFTGLAHARRGNRLEWAVIILIAIEICLSLIDLFLKF
ncbi:MAG: RMD1 family protein [Veillonellales bacterium]